MTYTIKYGEQTIEYVLKRRDRKTMGIEVHPDGSVHVIAPANAAIELVNERVLKRAAWILKQQRAFSSYPPPLPPREFVSGETYRYLGRQHRLKINEGTTETIRLWHGRIEITTTRPDAPEQIRKLLRTWFRNNATRVFIERYEYSRQLTTAHGINHQSGFKLLNMEKRWGSCTPDGTLLLNPNLVSASKMCIDYVITHELVHTVEHNHGPRFTRLLNQIMPDWQERRQLLNQQVEPMDL